MDYRSKCQRQSCKTSRRQHRRKPRWHWVWPWLFRCDTKGMIYERTDKLELIEIKNSCNVIDTIKRIKRQDTDYMTFWKRQSYGDSKISYSQGLRERNEWWNMGDFRTRKLFCMKLEWWIHAITYWLKPKECTPSWGNPDVNYGLWVMMMTCLSCRFIGCHTCTTLVEDVGSRGECMWNSVPSSQFCWGSNTECGAEAGL